MAHEIANLLAKLLYEYRSDFNCDSDKEFFPLKDAHDILDSEDEAIVQRAPHQQHDSTMIENKIWENHSTFMKQFPSTKSDCLLQSVLNEIL
ncbi:hypothetical protein AVEN_223228-1 [Araneus ventricosus]|uniref:Uncharacterized protein n=1 Tax=Araneus ventricosus TaxID=182803 RepID=A0A4Y2JGQ3_ARAVE|nr:hypothetical protein AVEN_223228-1 [Araneus ventricosus]